MLGNLKTANPKNLLPFILAIIPNIAIGIAAIKPTNNNFSISLLISFIIEKRLNESNRKNTKIAHQKGTLQCLNKKKI